MAYPVLKQVGVGPREAYDGPACFAVPSFARLRILRFPLRPQFIAGDDSAFSLSSDLTRRAEVESTPGSRRGLPDSPSRPRREARILAPFVLRNRVDPRARILTRNRRTDCARRSKAARRSEAASLYP